jgi:D-alanyl-D-alanine carboxypeptidase
MSARSVFAAASLIAAVVLSQRASAGPALLFDAADGRVLYAEDADSQWHPASLTKIMTAYLTFAALKEGKIAPKQKLPVSEHAMKQPPSKLGLGPGAQLLVDSALKALIIKSANDVAVVLAEAISGSEGAFVAKMNETARRLGMTRTTFVNPNGLPAPEQVTTARDLARLARAVVRDFPEYASYWSMYDAHIGKIYIGTHNGLLRSYDGADGMKTGFICDSGYNVVATATRDGRKLVAVVLGEESGADRTVRAASLLEHGFQSYAWKSLFGPQSIDTMPLPADAKSVTSMRQAVASWECGNGRRGKARRARGKGPKVAKPQTAEATPAQSTTPAKTAAPLPSTPSVPKAASAAILPSPVKPPAPPKVLLKTTTEGTGAATPQAKPSAVKGLAPLSP